MLGEVLSRDQTLFARLRHHLLKKPLRHLARLVDGTLDEAWAGHNSFKRKDTEQTPPDDPGNPNVDFLGGRRSNATHQSTSDPQTTV